MVIFNEAKPKYEKLDELLEQHLMNIRFSNQVNIIIDLKEVLKKFFRPDVASEIYSQKALIEEISSDVLNVIGHYRNYFYKKGKYTNFYFLYSTKQCEKMLEKSPSYKKEYYEKYFDMNDDKVIIMQKVVQVLEKVISVIPHAYFVDTYKYDEFIYAKYIKTTINENEIILILTNDDIFSQLVDKHTFIINIKGIKSELIESSNAINIITKNDEYKMSANMIPLILSLGGHKKYSISGLPFIAFKKACNIVEKLIEREIVKDIDSIEIPIEFSKLDFNNKLDRSLIDRKDEIIKNYSMIRGDELMYASKLILSSDFIFNKKIGTVNYFKELNSKFYTSFPLQAEMILKGEQL